MKHSRSVFAMTAGGTSLMIAALVLAAPDEDRFPISVDALHAKSIEIFSRVDTDGDGLISFEEFAAHDPKRRGRHSDRHSWGAYNRGGHDERSIRHADAMSQMDPALFEALDSNANGVIDPSEFSSQALVDARASIMKQQAFARMDVNDDGVLTPEEFPPSRMAALDTDGDGEITRQEMRDGRSEHWRRAG